MLMGTPTTLFSQEAVLNDIFDPGMITVQDEEMIVVEGPIIYVFSLPEISIKLSFGKQEQGPGEMSDLPYIDNRAISLPEAYFVDSQEKVLYFAKDGAFIREKKNQSAHPA